MGYSLEADNGHMASNETITSKPFISPPTNDLPVASPIPVTDLKPQSPGHEQALASRVFHLNHKVIGPGFPRSLADNPGLRRFVGSRALGTAGSAIEPIQAKASSLSS